MSDILDTSDGSVLPFHRRARSSRTSGPAPFLVSAMISGTVASVATSAVLALLARSEGRGALQPVNATSHWLHGPGAGQERDLDLTHTGVGYATHHASSIFWAFPLEWWLSSRVKPTAADVIGAATVTSAIAAVVDYAIVPRRLTPGWEHAVSRRSIAVTFGAMALGLAAGGLLSQALRRRSGH